MQHAPRAEFLLEFRVLRIIWVLRLLLGVQMIEVPEELIEAMRRRQELVAIAKMIFAELPADITLRFEHFSDRRVLRMQAEFSAGQPNFGETGPDRRLT